MCVRDSFAIFAHQAVIYWSRDREIDFYFWILTHNAHTDNLKRVEQNILSDKINLRFGPFLIAENCHGPENQLCNINDINTHARCKVSWIKTFSIDVLKPQMNIHPMSTHANV